MCVIVLGSPAELWPTVYPGFRREARLTPGYARSAFQAEETRPRTACSRARVEHGGGVEEQLSSSSALLSLSLLSSLRSPPRGYERSAFQAEDARYGLAIVCLINSLPVHFIPLIHSSSRPSRHPRRLDAAIWCTLQPRAVV